MAVGTLQLWIEQTYPLGETAQAHRDFGEPHDTDAFRNRVNLVVSADLVERILVAQYLANFRAEK